MGQAKSSAPYGLRCETHERITRVQEACSGGRKKRISGRGPRRARPRVCGSPERLPKKDDSTTDTPAPPHQAAGHVQAQSPPVGHRPIARRPGRRLATPQPQHSVGESQIHASYVRNRSRAIQWPHGPPQQAGQYTNRHPRPASVIAATNCTVGQGCEEDENRPFHLANRPATRTPSATPQRGSLSNKLGRCPGHPIVRRPRHTARWHLSRR